MRLFDTARAEVVDLDPGPLVTMYSCGITPYDSAHLGHAAVYLTFDLLQRRLRDLGHETRCVRNVTDVDDDILRKARELGVHYLDLAAEEMARFDGDMASLGLLPVYSEPRATSAIPEILSLVGEALDTGHAYRSQGAVYFDVSSFAGFGKVSHLGRDEMLAPGGRPRGTARRPGQAGPARLRPVAALPARRAQPGSRAGDRDARGGTSSARRWPCASSGRPSTSTAADATWSSPTTSARRPSPRRSPAGRSSATGCTWAWSAWAARRCPSPSATWCSWATW